MAIQHGELSRSASGRGLHRTIDLALTAMRVEFMRVAGLAVIVLFGLVAVEVSLLAAVAGSGPNEVSVPLVEQLSMLATLWQSNLKAALPLIAQTPVFVIARQESVASLQTWGLYFFPFTCVVHLAIAVVVAWQLRRSSDQPRRLLWLATGGVVLAFAITYARSAICCTGGPRWALELGLYALAFDPTPSMVDWSAIYMRVGMLIPFFQLAIGLAGIACIIVATLNNKKTGLSRNDLTR